MNLELTSTGMRLAFVSALVVVAALVVGYTTADGGYSEAQPIAPVPLTAVKSHGANDVTLARLTLTSRLQPASQHAGAGATVVQTPVVRQPVTPVSTPTVTSPTPQTQTPVTPRAPSSGGGTFDSSG